MTDEGTTTAITVAPRVEEGVKYAISKLKEEWGKAHILTDVDFIKTPPPQFMPVVSSLHFPKAKAGDGDVYKVPGGSKLAFTKTALDRFAAASGITWDHEASRRVDNQADHYFVEFRAVGHYRTVDGQIRTVAMTKRVDLRDEGADFAEIVRVAGKDRDPQKQIAAARQHILPMAESKAKNRVVREVCGLRSSYTSNDICKPFVVCKLVWVPPEGDPVIDRMIAAKELGMTNMLYGQQPAAQIATPAPVQAIAPPDDEPPPAVELQDDEKQEEPEGSGLQAPTAKFPF